FFFFQAEDGIRDFHVTGVQTCALPIWTASAKLPSTMRRRPERPWDAIAIHFAPRSSAWEARTFSGYSPVSTVGITWTSPDSDWASLPSCSVADFTLAWRSGSCWGGASSEP